MRIALIAITDEAERTAKIAGQPIAWHQLHSALAAGCERIVCLADAPGPGLAALQREAEAHGARFNAVAQPRALSGLVHAADTLFVFAPGVLVDRDWLTQTLGARAGVAVFPAEHAVARGYERVDREHAWAGVLATRGDAVESLAELPPDADPAGGLLRVALQRGARMVEVPAGWLDDGRWGLLSDAAAASRFETQWYARRVPAPGWSRPSEAAVYRIARSLASGKMMRQWLPLALGVGGVALAGSAAAVGFFGHTAAGLGLLVAGTLTGAIGGALGRFARVGTGMTERLWQREARDALFDLALVAIAASPSEFAGWPVPFAALVLIAAIRLAREPDAPRLALGMGDRVLVLAAAFALALAGLFGPGIAFLGLLGLALRLFVPKSRG